MPPNAGAKDKGKAKALPASFKPESSGGSSAIKPKISPNSRIRYSVREIVKDDGRCKRRGRNDGKLAQLMDMPLDVFFEITSQLKPMDLLQLSRVSKHFRQTFTAKSSRALWIAARKNASDIPPPPLSLSEPKYAALLFEHNCLACGVGRSPKLDHALSVRFCGACWKMNVAKGKALLRQHKGMDPVVLTLIPHEYHVYGGIDPKLNGEWNSYYIPEFDAVYDHYYSLPEDQIPAYVEERRQHVLEMHEHAKAVGDWEARVRNEQSKEEEKARQSRLESIEEKLFAMGYTKDDFPPSWYPDWSPYVNQPRVLTQRIWKHIQPKLLEAINANRQRKALKELEERLCQRRKELNALYDSYVAGLPQDVGPLPIYGQLYRLDGVEALLKENEGDTEVTQERFDTIVPDEVARFTKEMTIQVLERLQKTQAGLIGRREYVDPMIDHDEPSGCCTCGQHTPEPQENADNDQDKTPIDPETLSLATCLFDCGYCPYYQKVCRSFLEMADHIRQQHLKTGQQLMLRTVSPYSLDREASADAAKILKALDLPEDTKYADITRRVVCMCGDPKLEQPAAFGKIVDHLRTERSTWVKLTRGRSPKTDIGEVLHNDHNLEGPESCLKLIPDGEDFPTFEVAPVELDFHGSRSISCKICDSLMNIPPSDWYSGVYFSSAVEFTHHVRSKHLREPTQADVRD